MGRRKWCLCRAVRTRFAIGDEALEGDFHPHENPHLNQTVLAWMADFLGFLRIAAGGDHEADAGADDRPGGGALFRVTLPINSPLESTAPRRTRRQRCRTFVGDRTGGASFADLMKGTLDQFQTTTCPEEATGLVTQLSISSRVKNADWP